MGRSGGRTGVGIAGRGGTPVGAGGRAETGADPDAGLSGGMSGGRGCVVRGGSCGRETPGTGGVKRGIVAGRAAAGVTGATGAEAGAAAWAGGAAGAGGATDVIEGVTGRTAAGVRGRSGTMGAAGAWRSGSGIAFISPVPRDARATTPGVNVGVGFRRCGGGKNGVANGIDGRGVAGVRGTSTERRGGGGSNAPGAASASDSITARSFDAQADSAAAIVADPRAGVGVKAREDTGAEAPDIPTRMTAPQTEQRARTPSGGTLAGSTRNTD